MSWSNGEKESARGPHSQAQIVRVRQTLSNASKYPTVDPQTEAVLYGGDGKPIVVASDLRLLRVREISCELLEDGTILDLVRDPRDPYHIQFIVTQDNNCRVQDHFFYRGIKLITPRRSDHIVKHLMLPSGLAPYGTVSELARKIRKLICSCVAVEKPFPSVLAAFVVYDWLADQLPGAVYIFVNGVPATGKSTLLQVLRLLCRRALSAGDVSGPAMTQACSQWQPTLLLDEEELEGQSSRSRSLRRLLRLGTSREGTVLRRGWSGDSFGPKVLSSEFMPDDTALLDRCLIVPMVARDTSGLRKPTDPGIVEEANRLQNELLTFRLDKARTAGPVIVPGSKHLESRQRDQLSYLAAPFVDSPEWLGLLLRYFETIGRSFGPSLAPDCACVLNCLWVDVHGTQTCLFLLLSDFINGIRRLTEITHTKVDLNPIAIGRILKKLGIQAGVHTRQGNGFWLHSQNRRRVHELVWRYGLTMSRSQLEIAGSPPCPICQESELEDCEDAITNSWEGLVKDVKDVKAKYTCLEGARDVAKKEARITLRGN